MITHKEERDAILAGAPVRIVRGHRRYRRVTLALYDRLVEAVAILEGDDPRQNPGELLRWQAATCLLAWFNGTEEEWP